MSVLKLREAIRKELADGVKDLREVTTHGGRFDEAQLRAWGARAPCAIVAALGFPALEGHGPVTATVEWGVFIVTRDTLTLKRDEHMLILAPNILTIVHPAQRWGDFEGVWMPEDIKAVNLYGAKIDAMGLALWAASWTQKIDINLVNASDLADFLRVRGDFTLSDDPDVPTAPILVDLAGPP